MITEDRNYNKYYSKGIFPKLLKNLDSLSIRNRKISKTNFFSCICVAKQSDTLGNHQLLVLGKCSRQVSILQAPILALIHIYDLLKWNTTEGKTWWTHTY